MFVARCTGLVRPGLRSSAVGMLARPPPRMTRGDAGAVEIAQRWVGDEQAALRLRHAADLALAEASGLTDPVRTRSLAAWFDQANRTRDLLRTTVRADLAVTELLLAWRGASGARASGGSRR